MPGSAFICDPYNPSPSLAKAGADSPFDQLRVIGKIPLLEKGRDSLG